MLAETVLPSIVGPMVSHRRQAWERYGEIGLPNRKSEPFRYLRLRQFLEQRYPLLGPGEGERGQLVFVNGFYRPDLSEKTSLVVLPLSEAMSTYGAFVDRCWSEMVKDEKDPFSLMNGALHQEGVFLYLPPSRKIDAPVEITHYVDGCGVAAPRIHVVVGAGSELTITLKTVVKGGAPFVNGSVEALVEDGARLQLVEEVIGLPDGATHFQSVRAGVKRDGVFRSFHISDGAHRVRSRCQVALHGENAETELFGLWNLDGGREVHHHVLVDHCAPHCRSSQLFKGVLNDRSRSSFEGKIFVRQAAQKTDAYQLNQNLLLSELAHADSKPNLEVFADDVKASHGATVGQLDQDQLFYLVARGVSPADAKRLLVSGYMNAILSSLPKGVGCPQL
jgi:Fe-S cluster assembly protein SufD